MNLILRLLIIVILLGLNNCVSSSELLNNYSSLLTFSHEGQQFKIIGFSPKETEGYNLLIRAEGNDILIKCIDKQQDGILDEVIIGDIPLDKANNIYQEAIMTASLKGSITQKYFEKYYITSNKKNIFELRTYVLADGDIYNFFATKSINDDDVYITRDLLADGSLDYFEEGEGDLTLFQSLYDEVIQKGIRENKIKVLEGTFQIMK
jgi:hypothetical protein